MSDPRFKWDGTTLTRNGRQIALVFWEADNGFKTAWVNTVNDIRSETLGSAKAVVERHFGIEGRKEEG